MSETAHLSLETAQRDFFLKRQLPFQFFLTSGWQSGCFKFIDALELNYPLFLTVE